MMAFAVSSEQGSSGAKLCATAYNKSYRMIAGRACGERGEIAQLPPLRVVGRQLEFPAVLSPAQLRQLALDCFLHLALPLNPSDLLRSENYIEPVTIRHPKAVRSSFVRRSPSSVGTQFLTLCLTSPAELAVSMSDLFSVQGKIVLVTGGAKGVGWGASRWPIACVSCSLEGLTSKSTPEQITNGYMRGGAARVYIASRDEKSLKEAADEFNSKGYPGKCVPLTANLASYEGVIGLVQELEKREKCKSEHS